MGFQLLLNCQICYALRITWETYMILHNTAYHWVPLARLYWVCKLFVRIYMCDYFLRHF